MSLQFKNPFSFLIRARNWYARFERPISSLSLLGGFIFNIFALTRVDQLKENFWIAAHLLVVAGCIVFINRQENDEGDAVALGANPAKLHFWLINILQFMFGGLLSTFLVFYFRSAVLSVAWPFLLVLIIAFIANESLKRHYARLYFQISFFFLSIFLFAIFLVPVILHDINAVVFMVSGIVSVVVISLFILLLGYTSRGSLGHNRSILFSLIAGIFIIVNALYFLNFIPPLPLSLQDAGVYHSIVRTADGNYAVTYEKEAFIDRFKQSFSFYQTYHGSSNKPVYVFSAIFSPTDFTITTVHEWQKYDLVSKSWVTSGTVSLPVTGGREGGYRTYSAKVGLTTGKWRVNIKTATNQLLGRLIFNVVIDDTVPVLETDIKK